jgi:probable biosynthetic protein (TIGR04099 family)
MDETMTAMASIAGAGGLFQQVPPPNFSLPILVGMPQLSRGGLSENWLLKECGHRHWMLLAERMGLPVPDFRDARANRLYAAFTTVRLEGAGLSAVREHDWFRIRSSLSRISRTQFLSRHAVECAGAPEIGVEMISVFLRRMVNGSNRAVERGAVVERGEVPLDRRSAAALGLVRVARLLRSNEPWEHRGFQRTGRETLARHRFAPCPRNDFNGAEFLYFASFQAIVDRAEWAWWGDGESSIVSREIYFHGNIDVGETLSVVLCGLRQGASRLAHWCEVVRDGDGQKIADVFTLRCQTRALSPRRGLQHRRRS